MAVKGISLNLLPLTFCRTGAQGTPVVCTTCGGRGITVTVNQVRPGYVQQIQSVCRTCNGHRTIITDRQRCSVCVGSGLVEDSTTLEVRIPPGTEEGDVFVFEEQGDQMVRTFKEGSKRSSLTEFLAT